MNMGTLIKTTRVLIADISGNRYSDDNLSSFIIQSSKIVQGEVQSFAGPALSVNELGELNYEPSAEFAYFITLKTGATIQRLELIKQSLNTGSAGIGSSNITKKGAGTIAVSNTLESDYRSALLQYRVNGTIPKLIGNAMRLAWASNPIG